MPMGGIPAGLQPELMPGFTGNAEMDALWQSLWDPFFINDAASGLAVKPAQTKGQEVDKEVLQEIDQESKRWWSYCKIYFALGLGRRGLASTSEEAGSALLGSGMTPD